MWHHGNKRKHLGRRTPEAKNHTALERLQLVVRRLTRDLYMTNILIIDDDIELCEMVCDYLSLEGFDTDCAHNGEDGARQASSGKYSAVILDVMLPGMNGFDTLRHIRKNMRLPVLMLTARGEDIDRIVGLEMGADDYLPKPFNPRELIARLRAILRRFQLSEHDVQTSELAMGNLSVQPAARRALLNNKIMELTSSEFNILLCLIRQPDTVVTKETLSEEALGKALTRYDRSIDMHISHLRRKLGSGNCNGPQIHTVRGIGYQLTPADEIGKSN